MAAQTSALTEAQSIVQELVQDFGLTPSGIAKELGVKAMQVHNIARRHASGNNIAHRLVILREQMRAATHGPSLPSDDVPTSPLADALPSVESLFAPVKDAPEPSTLTLNADEPAPNAPKKLTEKAGDWLRAAMLGDPASAISQPGMSAPSRKRTKGEASEQGDLIEQLVPLAALLFVLTGSVLLPDPYKPCGPNTDEATAIAYPIVKRAVRELDARKRLSEATTDAIAILLAVGAYGVRAHETYKQIHTQEVERARSNRQPSGADFIQASGGGSPAPTPADAGTGRGVQDASAPLALWRNKRPAGQAAGTAGREPSREPASPEQRRADASIDALLAADHAGRLRLGL